MPSRVVARPELRSFDIVGLFVLFCFVLFCRLHGERLASRHPICSIARMLGILDLSVIEGGVCLWSKYAGQKWGRIDSTILEYIE